MKAFNSGDAAGVAGLYDPEGYFMPNGIDPVKGRAGTFIWPMGKRSLSNISKLEISEETFWAESFLR